MGTGFRYGRALAALVAVWLALAPAAAAQDASPVSLIAAGDYDGARQAVLDRGGSALDAEVVEALIAENRGDRDEAIARLRSVLRLRPDLVAVRRLLANLLANDGQYESAEFHFNELLSRDPDPDNRRGYNTALRRIFALKPYGFTGSFAIVPSNNINRGTLNDVFSTDFGDFVIDPSSQSVTGIGVAVSGGAFRRFDLGDGLQLQFDASLSGIFYDAAEFNQLSFTGAGTLRKRHDDWSWSLAPEVRRTWVAGERYRDAIALTGALSRNLSADTGLGLRLRAEHRDYATDTFLNGMRYETEVTLRRRVTPRLLLQGGLGYNRGDAASEAFRYDGFEVSGRFTRLWASGLQLSGGIGYEIRPYRGDFTGVTFPRDDRITSLDFSLFSDRWTIAGAAPTYSCRATFAQSNIAFYDYDVQECSIGFTRRF